MKKAVSLQMSDSIKIIQIYDIQFLRLQINAICINKKKNNHRILFTIELKNDAIAAVPFLFLSFQNEIKNED